MRPQIFRIIYGTLAILLIASSSVTAQRFNDLLTWLNTPIRTSDNVFYTRAMLTSNTFRTNAAGDTYQYASYAEMEVNTPPNGATEIVFPSMAQYFSDRRTFDASSTDRITLRIYRNSAGNINASLTYITWGGSVITASTIDVQRHPLGYVLRFRDISSLVTYFTVTISRRSEYSEFTK